MPPSWGIGRTKARLALLILLLSSCLFNQPEVKAQNVNTFQVFFHHNSLIINEPNGSFLAYEGVDALASAETTPFQVTPKAQISGTTSVLGFPIQYWSAGVLWGLRASKDLHVLGNVVIRVYISSNFQISGLISGSGYGMIVADVDENNNLVEQFESEYQNTIGGNVFTSTPRLYTLSLNVDHVFKAGHAVGVAIGFGANSQGYNATVYFDSANYPSGATLPIVDSDESYNFSTASQTVSIRSNSAIADYKYDSTKTSFQFTARLVDYTSGYCNITIPKTLMYSPFSVIQGTQQITPTLSETQTSYNLFFTHIRSPASIQVTGSSTANLSPSPTPITSSTSTLSPTSAPTPASSPTSSSAPTPTSPPTTPTGSTPTATNPTPNPTPSIPEMPQTAIIVVCVVTAILASFCRRKRG